jgi:ribonuclease P protein component
MDERFGKEFKLCSQKRLTVLFTKGKQVKSFPFILHFHSEHVTDQSSWQIGVSAPKRSFKKATERNRIKRLMREAIRKNKLTLESVFGHQNLELTLFLVYTAKEIVEYQLIERKINDVFIKLTNELKQNQRETI